MFLGEVNGYIRGRKSSSLLYVSLVGQDSDLFEERGNKPLVPWEWSVYELSVALSPERKDVEIGGNVFRIHMGGNGEVLAS